MLFKSYKYNESGTLAKLQFQILGHVVLLLVLLYLPPVVAGETRSVVLIVVDGLRPDAISKQRTPNIMAIIQRGVTAQTAVTAMHSITIPAHASLLSGLDSNHHGLTSNQVESNQFNSKTIFEIAREAGLQTAAYLAKHKLLKLITKKDVDLLHVEDVPFDWDPLSGSSARNITQAFARTWTAKQYAITLVHLREPDSAGHQYRWMSPEYLRAVTIVDRSIAEILKVIKKARRSRNTSVLITADHGGKGKHHASRHHRNYLIPWILSGSGFKKGYRIRTKIRIYDSAPTILAILGLNFESNIDGRIVSEAWNR